MTRHRHLLLVACLWALSVTDPAAAELGSQEEPIRCHEPAGERWYLSRLRLVDGTDPSWKRLGSFGGNQRDGHIVDGYESDAGDTLFLDMYHLGYVEIQAPPGYRLLTEWSPDYEYVDGLVHAWGADQPFSGEIRERDEDGTTTELTVVDGVIQGELVRRYPGGRVRQRTAYGLLNRPHGEERWLREDGSPWAVYHYADGVLHGLYEFYREDGELESAGRYVHGEAVGE